ncbi:hypothetical protein PHYBOEH_003424 [Phytophthora boehmeriae]|uniref:Uncharacterized protein n=1 Tax=Phytophthora boehmeriae TaxID=109152 RepID=A0A8T1WSN0_9STRA|nr:hypothetical protein PHYBOEH_003424 [Phytophthora boehmeriae]
MPTTFLNDLYYSSYVDRRLHRSINGAVAGCIVRMLLGHQAIESGELFLENDVAWELFACTDGQRLRFEEILSSYVDELSYFSGNAGAGSFATSKAQREKEYYQNELQNFVVSSIPSLGSLAVIAQRFYKSSTPKEGTSVLTFGKDIQMTTKTAPIVKLEAKRVDRVHVRSELQNCLARLRAMQMKGS